MYTLIGISMVLTGAMVASFATSVVLSLAWRALEALARRFAPKSESRFWMAVGLAPVLVGAFVGVIVVSAFVLHEPRNSGEEISAVLAALSALSALVITAGAARAALVLYRAARASKLLRACSRPMAIGAEGQGAYEIEDGSSTSTVVGILRPTMFFSRGVVAALTRAEFESVLRHEQAHVRAYDNALKLLLDFAGVLSGNPLFARAAKARWMESIELAADAAAVERSGDAIELLSALLKVARLRQSETPIGQLGCGFVRFSRKSSLRRRIEQLQRIADGYAVARATDIPHSMSVACRVVLVALAAIAAYAAPALMVLVHSGFERLMR